jgi:hypothetical protein
MIFDICLREREAFGSLVMGWRSRETIDIYDHTRDGERTLLVLATYQQSLSERQYVSESSTGKEYLNEREHIVEQTKEKKASGEADETIWLHDQETLAWVKKMQQYKDER